MALVASRCLFRTCPAFPAVGMANWRRPEVLLTPGKLSVKCKEGIMTALAEVKGASGRLAAFKIDAEENLGLTAEYEVRGVPTLLLLRHGALIDRKVGFVTAKEVRGGSRRTSAEIRTSDDTGAPRRFAGCCAAYRRSAAARRVLRSPARQCR